MQPNLNKCFPLCRTVLVCRQYAEADTLLAESCGFWMEGIFLVSLLNSCSMFGYFLAASAGIVVKKLI